MQDQAQGTIEKTRKEGTTLDHILDTADITTPAIITCTEATPGHCTRTDIAAIEVAQDSLTPHTGDIAADSTMTHHTSHTAHITVIQNTPLETAAECVTAPQATTFKTTVDPAHNQPTTHQSTGQTRRILQLSIRFQPWEPQDPPKKEHEGPNRRTSIKLLQF